MAVIMMVRHGDNDYLGKRLAGRLPDVHLNTHGQKQAKSLAKYLSQFPINAIYSSPLERARETAHPLSDVLNIPITINQNLTEIDYGTWQGQKLEDLQELPEWQSLMNNVSGFKFPQGESLNDARDRSVGEIKQIAKKYPKDILIACFTHADIIRLCIAAFLNMHINDYHRLEVNTGSISVIILSDKLPRVTGFNIPVGEKHLPADH